MQDGEQGETILVDDTRITATIGRSASSTAALDLQEESIWEMNISIGRNALDIGRILL